jgi:hypothetical protein
LHGSGDDFVLKIAVQQVEMIRKARNANSQRFVLFGMGFGIQKFFLRNVGKLKMCADRRISKA